MSSQPTARGAARFGSIVRAAPGVALAALLALLAIAVDHLLPLPVGAVLLAVVLGLLIGNMVTLPAALRPGLQVASNRVLRIGVVLLGARLTIGDVASVGASVLWVAAVCMSVAFGLVWLLGRLVGISPRLAVLVGVGTAVCGNSAIIATAPIVEAEAREVSFAVATITLLGTLALLLFPLLATAAALPQEVLGLWAGLAINDTSQAVAAGVAYGDRALEVATIVKLVRNTAMAPLVLLLAWWTARSPQFGHSHGGDVHAGRAALQAFPLFLVGFLTLAALRSLGALGDGASATFGTAASVAITIGITAIALSTRLRELRAVGYAPFLVGLAGTTVLASVAFAFAAWLGN